MNSHAAMMIGDTLSPSGFGSRHHAPSDSRLLMNLIKAERTYCGHLHSSVMSALGAASALSSWGTSETPDVAEASARLADLLTACADVQSTHVSAIEGYRSALKDVADREASIRTVVRDRDILVSRLIKASQKSGSASSKKSPEERAEKVAKAQRELAACEEVLTHEEAALVGVKRRTFKEALTMRMKTMGDAGAAMVEAAQEAILLLDEFDSSADLPRSPVGYNEGFLTGHDAHNYDQQYQDMYDADPYTGEHGEADEQHVYHNATGMPYYEDGVDEHGRHAVNHPAFENASVTPSQSASQIYNPAAGSRSSWQVPFPVAGIGTDNSRNMGQGPEHAQHGLHSGGINAENESETDDEEEWREAFNGEGTTAHAGGALSMPAPHHLGRDIGTSTFFAPHQQLNAPADQGYKNGTGVRSAASPAPPLPDKDQHAILRANTVTSTSAAKSVKKKSSNKKSEPRKSESRDLTEVRKSMSKEPKPSRKSESRELNYVPMPPIPSAPRLDASGVNMGPIPMAPKLYMPGASGDQASSSSDDGTYPGVMNRAGQDSWNSRVDVRRNNDEASSDGGHTARQRRESNATTASKKGFFGKVGKLFRASSSGPGEADSLRQQPRPGRSSAEWRTRTESNAKTNQRYASSAAPARKRDILSGPLVARNGEESSDEEGLPDPRHLVRHVNKGPPLWQNKASSDVGTSKKLIASVTRPKALRRTPSASVTAGPQSFRSQQESASRVQSPVPAVPASATSPSALTRTATNSTITQKKKKKKSTKPSASQELTSNAPAVLGKPSSAEAPSTAHTITVSGDASSGIRRNESLNKGSVKDVGSNQLAARSSKRLSQMSTQPSHSSAAKSAGAMRPMDPHGKFATNNWVAKSNDIDVEVNAPTEKAKARDTNKGADKTAARSTNDIVPSGSDAKSAAPAPKSSDGPRHVPQPSRTMSPPLKPALKPGSVELARSGSITSSLSGAGAFQMPILPAPVSAPPRVSDVLAAQERDKASNEKSASTLNIGVGDNYDGTGKLEMPEIGSERGQKVAATQQRTALPRIDMPASEPFHIDLESRHTGSAKAQESKGLRDSTDSALMTPAEQKALATYMSQEASRESQLVAAPSDADTGSVTRSTVRRSTVGSGVLGPKNVPPPSVNKSDILQDNAEAIKSRPSAPRTLSRSYSEDAKELSSDSSDDEQRAPRRDGAGAVAVPAQPTGTFLQPNATSTGQDGGHDHTPEGSGVSRRKSVRMAPDVKFPPETPPANGPTHQSKQHTSHHRGTTSSASHTSQLSSRIAPPPSAPPRLHVPSAPDRPIDLSSTSRERGGWSTRIGARNDSSSDEDEEDGYAAARRSFGTASQSWSQATGHPGSTSSKKKKKAGSSKNSNGYNPSVPLPVGMEVVGRSASFRRK